mmetsp:Transcript_8193/g.30230  ORF Transcript_8193/g.30230 Transcript_8193/m.30230 type:complete len:123 (+) Transcript_8193:911-1279(+)
MIPYRQCLYASTTFTSSARLEQMLHPSVSIKTFMIPAMPPPQDSSQESACSWEAGKFTGHLSFAQTQRCAHRVGEKILTSPQGSFLRSLSGLLATGNAGKDTSGPLIWTGAAKKSGKSVSVQ